MMDGGLRGSLVWVLAAVGLLAATSSSARGGDEGLLAYYAFDEGKGQTIRDGSGNERHGSIEGARFMKMGKGFALAFRSDGDAVRCPTLKVAKAVTLSAWIKASEKHGGELGIVGKGASFPSFCGITYYQGMCWFYVSHGANQIKARVPIGEWHHVTATFDGETMRLYIDGDLGATGKSRYATVRGDREDKVHGGSFFIGRNNQSSFRGMIDEVRIYDRALTSADVFGEYVRSASGIGMSAADIALKTAYSVSRDDIQVRVDCRALDAGQEAASVGLRLSGLGTKGSAGAVLRETEAEVPEGGRLEVAWPRGELPAVACTLVATIKDRDGRELSSLTRRFWLPAKPGWLGTREGRTSEVLSPWTPLKVEQEGGAITVKPWGRSYMFGPSLFPARIISQGAELLARPIRVIAVVAGKPVVWNNKPPHVFRQGQDEAALHQKARAMDGRVTFTTTTFLEYDGMAKCFWEIWPHEPIQLDKLVLEIPLRAEAVKLKLCYPARKKAGIGRLRPDGVAMPFQAQVWLGDEEKGLTFLAESDQDWHPASAERAVEIRPEGDTVVLRLRIIEEPRRLVPQRGDGPSLSYAFGFLATPVKPIQKDGWDYRFSTHWHYGYDYGLLTGTRDGKPALDYMAEKGIRSIILCNWTDWLCYPKPIGHERDLRALVREAHKRGIKIVPYFGYQQSMLCPEWPLYGAAFAQGGLGSGQGDGYGASPPRYRSQPVHQVCQNGPHQDFLVDGIARLIDEYDVDGVYLDTTGSIRACRNGLHGCGYTAADGRRVQTWPVFGIRECMKRIYTAVKTRKPDGIVDLHTGGGVTVPSLAWATSYYYGEQYAYLKKGTELKNVFDLPEFRTELMGHPFGVPADFLFPYSQWMTERQSLAVTLLHDVLVRPHESTLALELTSQLGRLSDKFDRKNAEWLPYWSNAEYVKVTPQGTDEKAGVFVSLYRHKKNGVLGVVSNLGSDADNVELTLDVARLGLAPGRVTAHDALTGAALAMKGGRIKLAAMAQLDWRVIRLQPVR